MRKLGQLTYKRILAQAEMARELGLDNLTEAVLSSLGAVYEENQQATYTQAELEQTVHHALWKTALEVIGYHDLIKVDIQAVERTVQDLKSQVIKELEKTLHVSGKVGANEPKLPGQE
jgi:hypothetical protein